MKKKMDKKRKSFHLIFIVASLFFASSILTSTVLAKEWRTAEWDSPKKDGSKWNANKKDKPAWQNIDSSDDLSSAEGNYQLYCSSCHGAKGDGKGDLAEALAVPPRNHTDASIMSKRTDKHIFKTISEGGEANGFDENMPPHNTVISKKEIRGLVKYIRKLCNCKYEGK